MTKRPRRRPQKQREAPTRPWPIFRAAFDDVRRDVILVAALQLMWLSCVLLVIPGPPGTLALFAAGRRLARGEEVDGQDFLDDLRRYFALGWRWGAVNGVVVLFLVVDFVLTGAFMPPSVAPMAMSIYLALLLLWLFAQIFVVAYLVNRPEARVRDALRRVGRLLWYDTTFMLAIFILTLVAVVLGTLLLAVIFAFGASFFAVVGIRVLDTRPE